MKLTKKGYIPRLIDKEIKENLEIFGAISIEGPKWCGKTWTALNHSNSVTYLNNTADNFREKHLAEMDVNLILDKDKPELIDEWQEVPAIWDAVRFKCDQDNEKGKYILTGSSVPVSDKIHHSGAGRIQVTIEGFNQDEYTTEAKEFKYYTLIETELPTNAEGEMKVEIVEDEEENKTVNNTIDVYYYYEAKPFNIGVEKEITGIVVNGETRTPTNGKLERVEIYRKDVEKTNIQIVYRIRVINSGEVEGAVTIEDKLPEGMNLVNNDGTWEEQDGILRKIIPEINPGETKEYTVVLNWNTAENNMGEKDNVINIVDTQNVPGFIDNNDKDNTSNANVIISVGTGELPIGLILALVALVGLETVTLRYAVVLTKRQKKKVNKK